LVNRCTTNGFTFRKIHSAQDLCKGGKIGRIDMNLTKELASGALALQVISNASRDRAGLPAGNVSRPARSYPGPVAGARASNDKADYRERIGRLVFHEHWLPRVYLPNAPHRQARYSPEPNAR